MFQLGVQYPNMGIIETHCHLEDERLYHECDRIVSEASSKGIEKLITIGSNLETSLKCCEIANKYDDVYCAVGIHPHYAKEAQKEMYDKFFELAKNKKVVAIGEIGLDYYYDLSERDVQRKVFVEQLYLADQLKLPVSLHIREALGESKEILFKHKHLINNGLLYHCYSGTPEFAEEIKELDPYFAFGGVLTFKNAQKAVESIKAVGLNRIVFETDAPYLAPVPFRGKTNYPEYINYVVDRASEILNIAREELIAITTENAKRLFFNAEIS